MHIFLPLKMLQHSIGLQLIPTLMYRLPDTCSQFPMDYSANQELVQEEVCHKRNEPEALVAAPVQLMVIVTHILFCWINGIIIFTVHF